MTLREVLEVLGLEVVEAPSVSLTVGEALERLGIIMLDPYTEKGEAQDG